MATLPKSRFSQLNGIFESKTLHIIKLYCTTFSHRFKVDHHTWLSISCSMSLHLYFTQYPTTKRELVRIWSNMTIITYLDPILNHRWHVHNFNWRDKFSYCMVKGDHSIWFNLLVSFGQLCTCVFSQVVMNINN